MADILSLPLEIWYYLVETTDIKVLNLRLACRALNARLRDIHLDQIYHSQLIIMTPDYLENLLKISKDPSAPHLRAHRLVVSTQFPNPSRGVKRDLGIIEQGALDCESMDILIATKNLASDHMMAVRASQKGDRELPLTSVIAAFPRLKTIAFRGEFKNHFSPFEFNLLYPSLGFSPRKCPSIKLRSYARDMMNWGEMGWDASAIWWSVLNTVSAAHSTKIQTITLDLNLREGGIDASVVDQSVGMQNTLELSLGLFLSETRSGMPELPNLRRLDMSLEFSNDDYGCFFRWLESVGGRLEYLDLSIHTLRQELLPTSVGLPRLRKLKIQFAAIDVDNFIAFLDCSRATLETLIIHSCSRLPQHEGQSFYQLLKYARGRLDSLRFFSADVACMDSDILMLIEGWEPGATCVGRVEVQCPSTFVLLDNLAELLDKTSSAGEFWTSVTGPASAWQTPDDALQTLYGGDCGSEFDSEGCESDDDYSPSEPDYSEPLEYEDSEYYSDSEYEKDDEHLLIGL